MVKQRKSGVVFAIIASITLLLAVCLTNLIWTVRLIYTGSIKYNIVIIKGKEN